MITPPWRRLGSQEPWMLTHTKLTLGKGPWNGLCSSISSCTPISNLNRSKENVISLSDKILSTAIIIAKKWKESKQWIIREIVFHSNVKRDLQTEQCCARNNMKTVLHRYFEDFWKGFYLRRDVNWDYRIGWLFIFCFLNLFDF